LSTRTKADHDGELVDSWARLSWRLRPRRHREVCRTDPAPGDITIRWPNDSTRERMLRDAPSLTLMRPPNLRDLLAPDARQRWLRRPHRLSQGRALVEGLGKLVPEPQHEPFPSLGNLRLMYRTLSRPKGRFGSSSDFKLGIAMVCTPRQSGHPIDFHDMPVADLPGAEYPLHPRPPTTISHRSTPTSIHVRSQVVQCVFDG
jgi:hypothetical protein